MTDYSFNLNTHEEESHYPLTNVTTGGDDQRRYLYYQLKISMQHGCQVTMVDGSDAMCKACEKLTGQRAIHSTFLEFETQEKYDGIWACASLLHLHKDEIPVVLSHLAGMLNKPNKLYLSFKYGNFEGQRNGRYFTDLTEDSLSFLIRETNAMKLTIKYGRCTKLNGQFHICDEKRERV